MSTVKLSENLHAIVTAPNGVSRLREAILGLGVQGKLVGQSGSYDSVDALLDEISRMRPGKRSPASPIPEMLPFTIPSSWRVASLDQISVYIQRGKGPKYVESSAVPVVSQKCVQNTGFDIAKARFVDEESLASYGVERFLQPGDLLWNSTGTGTVGRINIYEADPNYSRVVADSHVTVIRLALCNPRFLHSYLNGPYVQPFISSLTSGTTKQQELNTSTVRVQPVPVPPREEQDRIVEKIDALNTLCTEVEDALHLRDQASIGFSEALVAQLVG